MAVRALPNPKVDRINVERKIIRTTMKNTGISLI